MLILLTGVMLFALLVKINRVYIKFCGTVHKFNDRAVGVII